MKSLFRIEQDVIVCEYAQRFAPSHVVELGGDPANKYEDYFSKSTSYVLTNLDKPFDEYQDITRITYSDNSVESILCISVLQHVFHIDQAIDEIIRVLRPGGSALITNGFLFPVCMERDYYRLTPAYWQKRLQHEPVEFEIIPLSNRYGAIENLLMRPYGKLGSPLILVRKFLGVIFRFFRVIMPNENDYPLGVAIILKKHDLT